MSTGTGDFVEFQRLKKLLRVSIGALILVTVIGVAGYMLIGGAEHGLIDALYMTVITLTTVGFGEVIDLSANPAGRVFTIFLLIFGMAIVLYTVPLMAAFVIEGRLLHVFARRQMEKRIDNMKDHYVVGGDSVVASFVTRELITTGREVVVVSPEAPADEDLGGQEIPFVMGDPTDDSALVSAGVERAAGVIMAMEKDNDNLLGVFTARRLAGNARIVAAAETLVCESKLRTAGADAVVRPSRIGGLRLASELVRPTVVSFLDLMLRDEQSNIRVEQLTIPATSSVVGKSVASLGLDNEAGVVLLASRSTAEGTFDFKPAPETRLTEGMVLVVMTDSEGRRRLGERLEGVPPGRQSISL